MVGASLFHSNSNDGSGIIYTIMIIVGIMMMVIPMICDVIEDKRQRQKKSREWIAGTYPREYGEEKE